MAEIDNELFAVIQQEPTKQFPVILTFHQEINNELLVGKHFERLMDGIISTTLTGNEVMLFSENDTVEAIERNSTVVSQAEIT